MDLRFRLLASYFSKKRQIQLTIISGFQAKRDLEEDRLAKESNNTGFR